MKWSEYVKMKEDPDTYLRNMFSDQVNEFFKDKYKTKLWFETTNPLLGNISPNQMMDLGRFQKLGEFIDNSLDGNRP